MGAPIRDRDADQDKIHAWAKQAFGVDQATSLPQRGVRLLEEAIEAYQSVGGDPAMAYKLVDFVFARPPGSLHQELGGVGVCVLALAAAANLSAEVEEVREIDRVLAKPIAEFTKRNEAKNAAGFLAELQPSTFAIEFELLASTVQLELAKEGIRTRAPGRFDSPPDPVVRYRIVVSNAGVQVYWRRRDPILGEVQWWNVGPMPGILLVGQPRGNDTYTPDPIARLLSLVGRMSSETTTTPNGTPVFDLGTV